jgi:hypothetical protein
VDIFKRIIKYFLIFIIFIVAFPYLICPIYKFPEPTIFTGDKIYNPYEGMDSTHWHKGNFHVHSRMLFGLTNGRNSGTDKIIETYKKFGYDIIGISDYMHMNSESAVPLYEHGYGFIKDHFIILGAKKVNWFEILLFQNINHHQFMINMLKNDDNILAIAHPSMERVHEPGDFRYLTNYDLIEILRYDRVMTEYLDSALSNGHKTFILGDDDGHDINNSGEVAQCYNIINCDTLTKENILSSLKKGKSFSVRTIAQYPDFESKISDAKKIPVIENISLNGLNISLRINTKAKEIKFLGQNGITKKIVSDSESGNYDFKPEDTYIRTEIVFDKVKFYLNPFFRYNGSLENKMAEIDFWKTLLFRIIVAAAISFTIIFLYKKRKKIKKRLPA